ncbi:hypothetical protein KIN20_000573 [Parelaphostrongylus tenuis]|uniref:Uncharacterized protein n=1 Tax=Parelaphostrongylus tenuis TaxID=148309 RepID=A0AAD5MDV0_PARTN|nr:hypothetical protein KIN20_000573 [Parelaphostrongylus tenuis]
MVTHVNQPQLPCGVAKKRFVDKGTIQIGQTDEQLTKIEWIKLGDEEKVKTYNRCVD